MKLTVLCYFSYNYTPHALNICSRISDLILPITRLTNTNCLDVRMIAIWKKMFILKQQNVGCISCDSVNRRYLFASMHSLILVSFNVLDASTN